MLDPKLLRNDPERVAGKLLIKGYVFDVAKFKAMEERRKALQIDTQELQSIRNQKSKQIGQAKAQGQEIESLKAEMDRLAQDLKDKQQQFDGLQ